MEDSTIIQMSSVVSMEQLDNDDDNDVVFENNNRNVNLCEINEGNTNKVVCSAQRPTLVEEQREDKDSSFDNDTNNKDDNNNNKSKTNDNLSRISIDRTTNESHEIDEENDSDVIILPMTSNSDVTTLESSEQVNESSIHYSHSQQHQQLEEEHEEREELQNKELASPSLTESTILTELTAIVPVEDRDNKEMNLQVTQKLQHNKHKKPSSEAKERECTQPIMQLYKVEGEDDKFASNTVAQEEVAENSETNSDGVNMGSVSLHNFNEQKPGSRNTEESNNSAKKEECSDNMKDDMETHNTGDIEGGVADDSKDTEEEQCEERKVEMSHDIDSEEAHYKEEEKEENQHSLEQEKQQITSQLNFEETTLDIRNEAEQEEEEKEEDEEEMEAIEDEINVEANIDEVDDDDDNDENEENDENNDEDHEDESVEQEQSSQEEQEEEELEEQEEEDMASEYSHTYNNYYKPQLSLGQQRWTTSMGSAPNIAAATSPAHFHHHTRSLRITHYTDPYTPLHLSGNANMSASTSAIMANKDLEESQTPWMCVSHSLQGWNEMCGGGCVRKMNPTASHLKCFTQPFTIGEEPVLSLECKDVLLLRSTITLPSTKQEACVCAQVKCLAHSTQQTERNNDTTALERREKLIRNDNKSSKLNSPHESRKNKCVHTTTNIVDGDNDDDDYKKQEELQEQYKEEREEDIEQSSRVRNCVFFGIGLTTRVNEETRSFPLTLLQFDDDDGTAVLSVNSWKVTERDTVEQIKTIKSPIPIRLAHDSVMLKLVIRECEFDVWANDHCVHASIGVNNLKLGKAFPLLLNSGGPVVLRHVTVSSGNHPPESRVFQLASPSINNNNNNINTQTLSPSLLPSPSSYSAHNNNMAASHQVMERPSLRSPHSSLIHSHLPSRESPIHSGKVSIRNSPKQTSPPSTREMISPAPSFTPLPSPSLSSSHGRNKIRNNSPIGVATSNSANTSFSLPGSKGATAHGRTMTNTTNTRNTNSPTNIMTSKNNKEALTSTPIALTSSSLSSNIAPRPYTILSDPKRTFASTSTTQINQGQTSINKKKELPQNELQEEEEQPPTLSSSFPPMTMTGKMSLSALERDMNTKLQDTTSEVVNTIEPNRNEITNSNSKPIPGQVNEERSLKPRTKMSNTSLPRWNISYKKTPLNSTSELSSGNNNNNRFDDDEDDDDDDENCVKGSRQYKKSNTKTSGLFGEHTTYSDIQAYQREEEEEKNHEQMHMKEEEQWQQEETTQTKSNYRNNKKNTKQLSNNRKTTSTAATKQNEPVQVKTNTNNETKEIAVLPSPSSCLPAHLVNNNNNSNNKPASERKTKYDRPWCKSSNNNKGKNDESNDKQSSVWDTLPPHVDPSLAATIKAEIMERSPSVYWEDIAGNVDAKRLLKEAVLLPLLLPELFVGLVQPWRGVLLFGPPGTGKTMLAKAVATSAKTTFFTISASSINTKHYGESEKLMRTLFEMARHYAPSTIFFDEIDALVSSRSTTEHEASRRVKSELLQQMDGLHSNYTSTTNNNSVTDSTESNTNTQTNTNTSNTVNQVLVLATTNRPWDLDEAVRRRLEKRIYIPLPDEESRRSLITRHLEHLHVTHDVDVEHLVNATNGFSGADITIVLRDAAMMPVRRLIDTYSTEEIAQLKATGQLSVTPVCMSDFTTALQRAQPSVSQDSLNEYAKWAATYGST